MRKAMRLLLPLGRLSQLLSLSTVGIANGAAIVESREYGSELVGRQDSANTTLALPLVAESSQHWEGIDGTWSTFVIRVGTPESTYRVLPVTSWQEMWVVYGTVVGRCNTSIGVEKDCEEDRGGVFDPTKSNTWKQGDQQFLGLNEDLGLNGSGQYGFDSVGLGYSNSTGPMLPSQIVSAIVSDYFWFGILGMGFQPTNFSGYSDPQPSFSDSLFTSGKISSRSWSYTAGAYYRLKSVFGSLIFGGYDASRFTENDVVFSMTEDNLRDVVVTVRGMSASGGDGGSNTTLMSTPEFAFIDSSVPELWLPRSVCDAFEQAFGLQYDTASDLYLLDTSAYNTLKARNPSITITLANQKEGGKTTDIVLPYAAFDLSASTPKLPNVTTQNAKKYFPIRRARDDLYVLGRTFLQEAYVTTHYPSRTFNVSQCVFEDGLQSRLVALPEKLPDSALTTSNGTNSNNDSGSDNSGTGSKKLGTGAIVGIVIGALAAVAILIAFIFLCLRRRRKDRKVEAAAKKEEEERVSLPEDAVEIDSGRRLEKPGRWQTAGTGEQASSFTNEVEGNDAKVEIEGNPIMVPQELEADVPAAREAAVPGTLAGGGKTPMVEMGAQDRGLGYGNGTGTSRSDEYDIVSPTTDPNRQSLEGRRDGDTTGPSIVVSSPSVSEGTWSPTTPVTRRGSRFQERWN